MTDEDYQRKVTRAALAIVTDSQQHADRYDFNNSELARVVIDGELNDVDLVVGLLNMCTILLVKLERAGQPTPAVLADIGTRYGLPRPGPAA